jgi:hypothetical protein
MEKTMQSQKDAIRFRVYTRNRWLTTEGDSCCNLRFVTSFSNDTLPIPRSVATRSCSLGSILLLLLLNVQPTVGVGLKINQLAVKARIEFWDSSTPAYR